MPSHGWWNINAATAMSLATGGDVLGLVTVNTGAAGAILGLYDSAGASGFASAPKLATIDASSKGTLAYYIRVVSGIYAVATGGNPDVTIVRGYPDAG